MLSYRHGFHAGNFADVMKHAGLLAALDVLMRKPRPITVMDSHAGAGMYALDHAFAEKTGEWKLGVAPLLAAEPLPDALRPYRDAVSGDVAALQYPGSPELMRRRLRPQDRMILCELHVADAPALKSQMQGDERVEVHTRDGFEAMTALLPPSPRAGLLLIDPSYEVKSDYALLPEVVSKVIRRWPEGAILIWYPLLADNRHGAMLDALKPLHPKGWLSWELIDKRPKQGRAGMAGSGLILLNPPWTLAESWAAIAKPLPDILFNGIGETRLDHS